MSPEEKKQFEDLKKTVEELKKTNDALKHSASIPFEIDAAFRNRFNIRDITKISISTKGSTSENHEAGAAGLGGPDGFLSLIIAGTTYNLAYWL